MSLKSYSFATIFILSLFAFITTAHKLSYGPRKNTKQEIPTQEVEYLSYSIPNFKDYKFQINNFQFNDVFEGKKFHYFQTDQRVFMMKPHNDIMNISNFMEISIPDIMLSQQSCTHFAFDSQEIYSISACKDLSDNTTYLVMVSYLSSRPFYAHSVKTNISNTVQMKLSGNLLMILDQESSTKNRLLAYQINLGSSRVGKQPVEFLTHISQEAQIAHFNITGVLDIKSLYEIEIKDRSHDIRRVNLNSDTGVVFTHHKTNEKRSNVTKSFNAKDKEIINNKGFPKAGDVKVLSAVTIYWSDFDFLSNTTVHSWFYTFLIVFGCLIILSFCTQRTAEGRDTVLLGGSIAKSRLRSGSKNAESSSIFIQRVQSQGSEVAQEHN